MFGIADWCWLESRIVVRVGCDGIQLASEVDFEVLAIPKFAAEPPSWLLPKFLACEDHRYYPLP